MYLDILFKIYLDENPPNQDWDQFATFENNLNIKF